MKRQCKYLSGARAAVVMGLGRFGGGAGAARFLHQQGIEVLVTDLSSKEHLKESVNSLSDLDGITFRLGEHRKEDFAGVDLVVVNPAVKPFDNQYLKIARRAGAVVISEIQILVSLLPNPKKVIGVTGTAGKSTVSAMIAHLLRRGNLEGKVYLGGNFGGSLLDNLDEITPDDWVVLELSSFMLHWLAIDRWSPHIAVVTNLFPNHLDWHGSFKNYAKDKRAITQFQDKNDIVVIRDEDKNLFELSATSSQKIIRISREGSGKPVAHGQDTHGAEHGFSEPPSEYQDSLLGIGKEIKLPVYGQHNRLNALFAIAAAKAAGVTQEAALKNLQRFSGLPHRLQLVHEQGKVKFFNDSKSTTPQAAMLAVDSFPDKTVHLILGGYDKGADLTELILHAMERCAGIYTIGHTGPSIAKRADELTGRLLPDQTGAVIIESENLRCAVTGAFKNALPGQVILLSPACASWDQFENFQQRGDLFVEMVDQLTAR